jgi:hypothetical protein
LQNSVEDLGKTVCSNVNGAQRRAARRGDSMKTEDSGAPAHYSQQRRPNHGR